MRQALWAGLLLLSACQPTPMDFAVERTVDRIIGVAPPIAAYTADDAPIVLTPPPGPSAQNSGKPIPLLPPPGTPQPEHVNQTPETAPAAMAVEPSHAPSDFAPLKPEDDLGPTKAEPLEDLPLDDSEQPVEPPLNRVTKPAARNQSTNGSISGVEQLPNGVVPCGMLPSTAQCQR